MYGYHIIHPFDPECSGWPRICYQPWIIHPLYISTFQIHHMDYPSQDFTKLKYSNALSPIIWRSQSHFDSHIDFASTWLYPVVFHHYIKNVDSLIPKHNELLANHHGDLRSEEHLCLYPLWASFDSRVLSR